MFETVPFLLLFIIACGVLAVIFATWWVRARHRRLIGYASIVASFPFILFGMILGMIIWFDNPPPLNRILIALLIWIIGAVLLTLGIRRVVVDRRARKT